MGNSYQAFMTWSEVFASGWALGSVVQCERGPGLPKQHISVSAKIVNGQPRPGPGHSLPYEYEWNNTRDPDRRIVNTEREHPQRLFHSMDW